MPLDGPAPKEGRVRRNKDTFEDSKIVIIPDGIRRGPELPDDFEWHPRTLEWWESIRVSPQAQIMDWGDWEMMQETAILHTRFYVGKMSSAQLVAVAGELRRRMAAIGATYEDRLKLRMKIQGEAAQISDDDITGFAKEGISYFDKINARAAELREAEKKDR